jgi:hypothetical protein
LRPGAIHDAAWDIIVTSARRMAEWRMKGANAFPVNAADSWDALRDLEQI